jgi:flagellar basal-body rod protein FlgC
MNLFGLMQTSGSAMQAERVRAEVVAANMANAETTQTESGGPYRRHMVVFAADQGNSGFLNKFSNAAGGLASSGPADWSSSGLASSQVTTAVEVLL